LVVINDTVRACSSVCPNTNSNRVIMHGTENVLLVVQILWLVSG